MNWGPLTWELAARNIDVFNKLSHICCSVLQIDFIGGAEWKVLRNNFNKTMTMELLKNRYHNIILKRNKYFVEYLKESYCDQDIPILQKIYRLNSDIFGGKNAFNTLTARWKWKTY